MDLMYPIRCSSDTSIEPYSSKLPRINLPFPSFRRSEKKDSSICTGFAAVLNIFGWFSIECVHICRIRLLQSTTVFWECPLVYTTPWIVAHVNKNMYYNSRIWLTFKRECLRKLDSIGCRNLFSPPIDSSFRQFCLKHLQRNRVMSLIKSALQIISGHTISVLNTPIPRRCYVFQFCSTEIA